MKRYECVINQTERKKRRINPALVGFLYTYIGQKMTKQQPYPIGNFWKYETERKQAVPFNGFIPDPTSLRYFQTYF